jgi:hypothetical protein
VLANVKNLRADHAGMPGHSRFVPTNWSAIQPVTIRKLREIFPPLSRERIQGESTRLKEQDSTPCQYLGTPEINTLLTRSNPNGSDITVITPVDERMPGVIRRNRRETLNESVPGLRVVWTFHMALTCMPFRN